MYSNLIAPSIWQIVRLLFCIECFRGSKHWIQYRSEQSSQYQYIFLLFSLALLWKSISNFYLFWFIPAYILTELHREKFYLPSLHNKRLSINFQLHFSSYTPSKNYFRLTTPWSRLFHEPKCFAWLSVTSHILFYAARSRCSYRYSLLAPCLYSSLFICWGLRCKGKERGSDSIICRSDLPSIPLKNLNLWVRTAPRIEKQWANLTDFCW